MENNSIELLQDEKQKFLELIDKVNPCIAISEKENLEKFKEWLDSDRSKKLHLLNPQKHLKIRLEMVKCVLYQQIMKL